jgi:Ca2+-binding RTX toxin-like protein
MSPRRRQRIFAQILQWESLESRAYLAITASFVPGTGVLTVNGDALANSIVVSRNAAGSILVNGGAVAVTGGAPTVANTGRINVFGLGAADVITLDETNGPLPASQQSGGEGNDTLTGGSGSDTIFGENGLDVLSGRAGADSLFGGADNDVLTGGDGNDQALGDAGNDRMIWNPGDDTDLNEGGAGTDITEINGGNGVEVFATAANGTRVSFDRVTPAPFTIDIGTSENVVLNMNGGDDSHSASGDLAALIALTVDGGAGNDSITGGNGADVLLGGDGNDFIDGNQGSDVVFLGAGDDTFQWDPGDLSDVVEGQAGVDTMLFNGSNATENIDISANGPRVRFVRDVAAITMDVNDVEKLDFRALLGADNIVVGDLSGTGLTEIGLDLRGSGASGDGQADTITVSGTQAADVFGAASDAAGIRVFGLHTVVNISFAEQANDQLTLNGLGGDDVIDTSSLATGSVQLTMNGGLGADIFLGGPGEDLVNGGDGNDTALMGAGDDTFVWNPGDDNDTLEGQVGFDTMLFNGANAAENINILANGGRVLFTRDVANVVMDLNDVEGIDFSALGGVDTVMVNSLVGTDVNEINVNLAAVGGAGDAQPDTVIVNGTAGADAIGVMSGASGTGVVGLSARVNVTGGEAANDQLTVNGLDGSDTFGVTPAAGVPINVNGSNPVPPASPGDRLNYSGAGTVQSTGAGSGNITRAGFQDVRFNGIEGVNLVGPGPTITSSVFNFNTEQSVEVRFSEQVSDLTVSELQVRNLTTGQSISPAALSLLLSGGGGTPTTARWRANSPLPDGNYEALLPAGAGRDVDGLFTPQLLLNFFVFAGDANGDRSVGFADLVILAQNYNTVGKAFGQGNFSYDPAGAVNFQDLVLLAQRYGTTLPVAAPGAAAAPETALASVTPEKNSPKSLFSRSPAIKPIPARPQGASRMNSR